MDNYRIFRKENTREEAIRYLFTSLKEICPKFCLHVDWFFTNKDKYQLYYKFPKNIQNKLRKVAKDFIKNFKDGISIVFDGPSDTCDLKELYLFNGFYYFTLYISDLKLDICHLELEQILNFSKDFNLKIDVSKLKSRLEEKLNLITQIENIK